MKESRRISKSDLNLCKANECEEIGISTGEKYKSKDHRSFWKQVKKKKSHLKESTLIDGSNKTSDIIGIFSNIFLNNASDNNRNKGSLN